MEIYINTRNICHITVTYFEVHGDKYEEFTKHLYAKPKEAKKIIEKIEADENTIECTHSYFQPPLEKIHFYEVSTNFMENTSFDDFEDMIVNKNSFAYEKRKHKENLYNGLYNCCNYLEKFVLDKVDKK